MATAVDSVAVSSAEASSESELQALRVTALASARVTKAAVFFELWEIHLPSENLFDKVTMTSFAYFLSVESLDCACPALRG